MASQQSRARSDSIWQITFGLGSFRVRVNPHKYYLCNLLYTHAIVTHTNNKRLYNSYVYLLKMYEIYFTCTACKELYLCGGGVVGWLTRRTSNLFNLIKPSQGQAVVSLSKKLETHCSVIFVFSNGFLSVSVS